MMDKDDEYCVYILVHDCICILYIWYKTKIFFLTMPVLGVHFSVSKVQENAWGEIILLFWKKIDKTIYSIWKL